MATLDELCVRKHLIKVSVRLPRHLFEDRKFYAYPSFLEWLNGPVRQQTSFDPSDIAPARQAIALLTQFIGGQPLRTGRQFKRMRPAERDVFELCTPDLRIFGWFVQRDVFVAVVGDFMERTHGHDLYPGYRDQVVAARDDIDLDAPKWVVGATEDDVISL